MFQLFDDNSSITPRTYSMKGYRRKKGISIKKILLYFFIIVGVFLALGITALSAYGAI